MLARHFLEIFTDKTQSTKLADIRTKKVIDWSARYVFEASDNSQVGSVGRKGWRSIWKASYDVFGSNQDQIKFTIREENPMAKIFDSFLGEIPILGLLTGYLFNPKYIVKRANAGSGEQEVVRLTKKPAFFESSFEIDKLGAISKSEELNIILSLLMMMKLERHRG